MQFGIKPERPKSIWWGARAIYEKNYDVRTGKNFDRRGMYVFSTLGDRQQMEGGTEKERKAFERWINKKALPALQRLLKKEFLGPESADELSFDLDGYYILASPRRSFGYLYIGIYPVADAPPECASCSSTRGRRSTGECIDCGGTP